MVWIRSLAVGERRGRRVVLGYVATSKWKYRCDCGAIGIAKAAEIKKLRWCRSCLDFMCKHYHARHRKSSYYKSDFERTYNIWKTMKYRCSSGNCRDRGIALCKRWRKFENFLADMGEKPEGMWLLRIDKAGDYEPDNCEWGRPKRRLRRRNLSST